VLAQEMKKPTRSLVFIMAIMCRFTQLPAKLVASKAGQNFNIFESWRRVLEEEIDDFELNPIEKKYFSILGYFSVQA
jgi:hypothetical protein